MTATTARPVVLPTASELVSAATTVSATSFQATTTKATTTSAAAVTTIFASLFGDQLVQHSTDKKTVVNTYIPADEIQGKTIALYFS